MIDWQAGKPKLAFAWRWRLDRIWRRGVCGTAARYRPGWPSGERREEDGSRWRSSCLGWWWMFEEETREVAAVAVEVVRLAWWRKQAVFGKVKYLRTIYHPN